MNYEELIGKVAKPFIEKQTFYCGSAVILPGSVAEVHFNETTQPSSELLPFIRAERKSSNSVTFLPDSWYLTNKGNDVTRKVLDDATSRSAERHGAGTPIRHEANTIFIVHGHDIAALEQTELLLRRWGLEPVILRERANQGMTVIEKVEANTAVGYAVVILSHDMMSGEMTAAT